MTGLFAVMQAAVAACSQWGGDYTQALSKYAFGDALVCPFWDAVGQLATGLLVWGAVGTAIYIVTGSVMIPYVLLLLIGGAVISQVASLGVTIATIIILGVLGGVPTYFVWRYSP
jgi:hypothetical protein